MGERREEINWAALRNVDLTKVAEHFQAEQHTYDKKKWHTDVGTISIDAAAGVFFNHNEVAGGKGAINLWCHLSNLDSNDKKQVKIAVEQMMQANFVNPDAGTDKSPARRATRKPKGHKPLRIPEVVESRWPAALRYLTEERSIPRTVIDPLHESGRLYAGGKYGNVTWLLGWTDGKVYGADLKGIRTNANGDRFGGVCPGTNREKSFFLIPARDRSEPRLRNVAMLEASIDAMSYAALHPHSTVISLGGCSNYGGAVKLLQEIVQTGVPLYHGFDHDKAGCESDFRLREHYAEATGAELPIRWDWPETPGDDWNEVLREIVSALPDGLSEAAKMARIEAEGAALRARREDPGLGSPAMHEPIIEALLEKRRGPTTRRAAGPSA